MFSKTRHLLRGMSAPFKLAWLLLVAGMLLFIVGMLPTALPTMWPGLGTLVAGILVTTALPRDYDDPHSTDGTFRHAVFTSLLLNSTVLALVLAVVIGLCGLAVGLFTGFDFSLLVAGLRMLLIALAYCFVTGIPACASTRSRPSTTS